MIIILRRLIKLDRLEMIDKLVDNLKIIIIILHRSIKLDRLSRE